MSYPVTYLNASYEMKVEITDNAPAIEIMAPDLKLYYTFFNVIHFKEIGPPTAFQLSSTFEVDSSNFFKPAVKH